MHMVHISLVQAWRYQLTNREKYYLWFLIFNTGDRVRLWNRLVFSRAWFRRTINFSKRQFTTSINFNQKNNSQDFVRNDINYMLKALSRRMYERGISHEDLLLHKISVFVPRDVDAKRPQRINGKKEQERVRDMIYTSNEMRKLWT